MINRCKTIQFGIAIFFLTKIYTMEEIDNSNFEKKSISEQSKQLIIKTKGNQDIILSQELASLSSVLKFTFFDPSSNRTLFEDTDNRVWDLSKDKQDKTPFFIEDELISIKSFLSFKDLLKDVLAVKAERLSVKKLTNKLKDLSLSRKIDCIILADFLDVPELKGASIEILGSLFEYEKYDYEFFRSLKFYNIIHRLRVPFITQLASFYFVNKHFKRFNRVLKKMIKRDRLFYCGKNLQLNNFDEQNNILFTKNNDQIEYTYLNSNLTKKINAIKLFNPKTTTNFVVSNDKKLIAAFCIDVFAKKFNKSINKSSTIAILHAKDFETVNEISIPENVSTIAFDRDSKKLAILTYNSKVFVYDLYTNSENISKLNPQFSSMLEFNNLLYDFVAFNKWSTSIIVATGNGEIIEKDIKTDIVTKKLSQEEPISLCAIYPSHQKIITYSINGKINIWNLFDQKIDNSFYIPNKINKFSFPPFGSSSNFVIAQADKGAYLLDLKTCKPLVFISRTKIDNSIMLDENNLLILNSTRHPYLEKFDLSALNEFFYFNDQLYEHLILIYTKLMFKKLDLTKAKPHVKSLLKTMPEDFKDWFRSTK